MLANGGVRREPRLIRKIGGRELPLKVGARLVSQEVASLLLDYMEAVIQTDAGTGKSLRIPGYRLAGKTGTAQKINPDTGTVAGGGYVSNFVGFVPADQPKAMILVMIDRPRAGKYYGASVAGPAFVEIARAVIRRLQIPHSPPKSDKAIAVDTRPVPDAPSLAGNGISAELVRRGVTP